MTNVLALPAGTDLIGDFKIERVLGAGGFGITYLAEEKALARLVTIKEYFPSDYAARGDAQTAVPRSQGVAADYTWGLDRFIEEAKTLARFDHSNIVRVYRYFEANNTAYMVLHFEEGASLKGWLRGLGRAPRQRELDDILAPLLDALEYIHGEDFLHRDIAPDNIIIRKDGSPVLIDFGSARGEIARHSRTVSALVKPGYSPYEQYAETGARQGPWTDIYALGATLYHAITGKRPPDAPSRVVRDDLLSAREAAIGAFRPRFLSAIDRALALEPARRPPSIAAWRGDLLAPESAPPRQSWLGRAAAAVADSSPGQTRVLPPHQQPGATPQPPPPDAPGRQGGLVDYIDALKRKAEPGDAGTAILDPPPAAVASAPEPAAQRSAPAPAVSAVIAVEPRPGAHAAPQPRRRPPRPAGRGWLASRMRPLLVKLAIGAGIAGTAVAYQHQIPTIEIRGSSELASATREVRSATPTTHFAGHRRGTTAVRFADGGRQLVTTGVDGTLKVWNTATGALVRTLELDNGAATAFDVQGRRALTGHGNGTVDLWDLDRGDRIGRYKSTDASIWSVAFSSDQTRFAASSHDWSVAIWEIRSTAGPVSTVEAHDSAVQAVAWSPSGTFIATGSADRTVKLWRAGSLDPVRTYRGHREYIGALAFSPDGKMLASASYDGNIRVWSTASSKLLRLLTGHRGRITALAFSPGGDLVASAGEDGGVRLWTVRNARAVRSVTSTSGPANGVAFSPDGTRLAVASADGAIRLWPATPPGRQRE